MAAFVPVLAGCAAAAPTCYGNTCPEGLECLANQCVAPAATPVPMDAARWVLAPTAIAVVADDGAGADEGGLPASVVFGGAIHGDVTLLLRFAEDWKQGGAVSSAFLLLDPSEGSLQQARDVELEVSLVATSWTPHGARHRRRPSLSSPKVKGLARSHPPLPLRVDVTALARRLSRSESDFGVAVVARGGDGAGAAYRTGAAGGPPPRLELYLKARGATP